MSVDLGPVVDAAAQGPQSAMTDGTSATSHPLAALIEADRYSHARSAQSQRFRGVMFSKLIPAGPVSDSQAKGFNQPGGPNLGW